MSLIKDSIYTDNMRRRKGNIENNMGNKIIKLKRRSRRMFKVPHVTKRGNRLSLENKQFLMSLGYTIIA